MCNVGAIQFNLHNDEKENIILCTYNLIKSYFNTKMVSNIIIEFIDNIISKI